MPGRMHVNSPQKVSPSRMDDLVQFYKVVKQYSLPLGAANDEMIAWGDDKALSKHKVKTIDLAKCIMSKEVNVFSPKDADHLFDNFYFSVADLNKRFGQDAANTSLGDQPDSKSA